MVTDMFGEDAVAVEHGGRFAVEVFARDVPRFWRCKFGHEETDAAFFAPAGKIAIFGAAGFEQLGDGGIMEVAILADVDVG